jgi:hypothetical protein
MDSAEIPRTRSRVAGPALARLSSRGWGCPECTGLPVPRVGRHGCEVCRPRPDRARVGGDEENQ